MFTYAGDVHHSVQVARALHERGLLAAYVGPYFSKSKLWGHLPGRVGQRLLSSRSESTAGLRHKSLLPSEVLRFLGTRTESHALSLAGQRIKDQQIDRYCHRTSSALLMTSMMRVPMRRRELETLAYEHRALHPDTFDALMSSGERDGFDLPRLASSERFDAIRSELQEADIVIVYSEVARQSLIDAGVEADRVRTAHLGVGNEVSLREQTNVIARRSQIQRKVPRVAFVGRCDFIKGFDIFVNLSIDCIKEAQFVAVGPTSSWSSNLTQGRSEIKFTGAMTRRQLDAFWEDIQYLVLPSRGESFGLVVLEAMRHGVVPIVSAYAGVSEVLEGRLRRNVFVDTGEIASILSRDDHRDLDLISMLVQISSQYSGASFGNRVVEALGAVI